MKQNFNLRIPTLLKLDEINMFRLMADLFNTNTSKSIFVGEVHGHKGFIDYNSIYLGKKKKIEIADLLLITCNKRTNEIRLSFIQAKYRRGNYRKFLTFGANLYQWELLKYKPNIIDTYHKGFPPNILNFSTYDSITSFGIFYEDQNGQIDFLYTLPRHIKRKNTKTYQTMDFNAGCHGPNLNCLAGLKPNETISTCSIDMFEKEALACRIGAPIVQSVKPYLASLLNSMRFNIPDNQQILDEFIRRIDYVSNDVPNNIYYPNTILLLTDGNEINRNTD